MFAASAFSLQAEPVYPKNFADLGCKMNSKGQIVQVSNEHEFIPYHISSNERESEIHMEAVHSCVRKAVAAAAAGMGIKEVHLTESEGDVIMSTQPRGPHLRIFTSDLEHLKRKKNVLIVISEHDQDPGIWKWKHVMTEGGIDGGTMIGLMESLTKMIMEGADLEEAIGSEQTTAAGEGAQAGQYRQDELRVDSFVSLLSRTGTNDPATDGERFGALPGVIFLNPGESYGGAVSGQTPLLTTHHDGECAGSLTMQYRSTPLLARTQRMHDTSHMAG